VPTVVRGLLLVAWITTGCYAYRPVVQAPVPNTHVRVVFTSAFTVATVGLASDTVRQTYDGVLEASGHIQAAAADTIALRLGELRTATATIPSVSDRIALLPTARVARIEEKRFQAGTTVLVGLGASLLVLTAYIAVVTAAIFKGF
jgi:hypothetical protein